MNPVLAVLAHAQAAKTVAEFAPRWDALGVPVIYFLPEYSWIPGIENWRTCGKSAHKGFHVFDRFLQVCEALDQFTEYDPVCIIEYDTVCLRPEFPTIVPDGISSCLISAEGFSGERQLCMLSPWVFSGSALREFVAAGRKELTEDPEYAAGGGLLDRWIGHVCAKHNLPMDYCDNALGYPWFDGAHEKIRRLNPAWVHGWKTKEDFGDLWEASNSAF